MIEFELKGVWGKWTLFDESTRVPLMIHAPSFPFSDNRRYSQPVELIDIFPTLVELTGVSLQVPLNRTSRECFHGRDGSDYRRQLRGSKKNPSGSGRAELLGRLRAVKSESQSVQEGVGVKNSNLFTHKYCDELDGQSLVPIFMDKSSVDSFKKTVAFGLSQKMLCKSPGSKDNNPNTAGWTDYCPFKKYPRDPAFGSFCG